MTTTENLRYVQNDYDSHNILSSLSSCRQTWTDLHVYEVIHAAALLRRGL